MTERLSLKLNIPLYICTTCSLSTPLWMHHLGCFHVLAVVNSAVVNNGVHVSFEFQFVLQLSRNQIQSIS